MRGYARLRRWSMGGAAGAKLSLAKRSMVGKNILQMKPHWLRKPFQVAAGHSINVIG